MANPQATDANLAAAAGSGSGPVNADDSQAASDGAVEQANAGERNNVRAASSFADRKQAPAARISPHDMEAEMALLGSMMLDRQAVELTLPIINRGEAEWFYRPDHRLLFQLLSDLYDRNEPIDLIVVQDELRRRNQLDQVGGADYLISLAESVPTWVNAEYYARIVRDKGLLRDLIRCTGEITEEAYNENELAQKILDLAEERMFAVTERRVSNAAERLVDVARSVYSQIEERKGGYLSGLPTGFQELDDLTSGLQNGDLIIVAGRPSMGKTSLGLNIAEHMAVEERHPVPVAFFSLEMSREQIALRILCSRGKVNSHRIRRGMLSEEDIQALGYICEEIENAPLYIDDSPSMTILELRSKARRLKRQFDIQAVFVDYLQLLRGSSKSESRQQEIALISSGLKSLGRELSVPVIAMAQLNRAAEAREGNRPRMADLRESGAIEQDADLVILLHREEYFKPQDESVKNQAEAIVEKQRNGPTATVKLHFNKKLSRFSTLAIHPPTQTMAPSYDEVAPF